MPADAGEEGRIAGGGGDLAAGAAFGGTAEGVQVVRLRRARMQ